MSIPQQDMALSSLFALGLFISAISSVRWIYGWWEWHEFLEDLEDSYDKDIVEDLVDELNLYFDKIFGAMCASAVSIPFSGGIVISLICLSPDDHVSGHLAKIYI